MALLNQYAEAGGNLIEVHSVSVNPTSLATLAEVDMSITITGVVTTDIVTSMVSNNLEVGLIWKNAYVSAADTVVVTVANISAGTIDGAACTGYLTIIKNNVVTD